MDDGTDRNHRQRKTVSSPRGLGREHTGINHTTHRREEVVGDTASVALHGVALADALGSEDVGLLAGRDVGDERDVRGAVGVALDPVDGMRAGLHAEEVDGANTTLVAAAAVTDDDAAGVVAAAFAVALLGEGERLVGFAFPEVVVDSADEMTDTGGAGLVALPVGGGKRCVEGGW